MGALSLEQEIAQFEARDQQLKALIAQALHAFREVWTRARPCVPPTAAPWFERVCSAEQRILASAEVDDQGRAGPLQVSAEIGLRLVALQTKAAELLVERFVNPQPSEDLFLLRVALTNHLHAMQAVRAFQDGGQTAAPPGPDH